MTATSATPSIGIVRYIGAQDAAIYGLADMLRYAGRTAEDTGLGLEVEHFDENELHPPDRPLSALVLPPSLANAPPYQIAHPLADWLHARHNEGTVVCSVCVGAFLLAELGMLDGRPATTHWALKDTFTGRFPEVKLDTDRIIVDDGDVITAGGLMAWVDLGLRLVDRFIGPTAMLTTARAFLVDPGGREQRFYASFSPVLTHGDEPIMRVQRWLQQHIGQPVTVESMAKHAGLSRRTFLRRFQRATGLKTTEYLQHLRIGRARELLERTPEPLQQIAWAVGYEDPSAFHRVFVRLIGLAPAEYRRRFTAPSPGVLVKNARR